MISSITILDDLKCVLSELEETKNSYEIQANQLETDERTLNESIR